jgi:DNA-binding IclR family transcriptional regulator
MKTCEADETQLSDARVPSVDRALNLLDLLASSPCGMNLTTISRRLNIPKSSAYYLLTTLAKRNFVRRTPDGRLYSLAIEVSPFMDVTSQESGLKSLCAPFIRSLSKSLRMTAQTGIREGCEARIIDRSEMPGLTLDSWVGRHFDLHCTAIGKALIAFLPDAEVENLFRARGLPKHNENTICSLDLLKAQLADARSQGFSTDDEEHELGVRCVASPIFNHVEAVVGAICIFSPSSRLSRADMPNIGLEVAKVAREISRALNDSSSSGFTPKLTFLKHVL